MKKLDSYEGRSKFRTWAITIAVRTAISHMRALPRVRDYVAKVANHTDKSVTSKVYDRYAYDKEKRAALNAWARKLQSILSGEQDNVVPMVR